MSNLVNKLYFKSLMAKEKVARLLKNERGDTNIIAIIIILAIVIALAIIFRKSIMSLFDSIWKSITGDVTKATEGAGGGI